LTQEISDEALCQRVAAQDEAAFDLLVGRYQGRAYRLAWSMLRDAEDARDVSQEAFLRVYRTAGSFRGDARFSTWFYRILVNLCRDRLRERVRRPIAVGAPADRPTDDRTAAVDDRLVLDRAFAELSPDHRVALVLRFYADLPVDAIAELVGVPAGTVKSRIHVAVSRMRDALGDDEGGPR